MRSTFYHWHRFPLPPGSCPTLPPQTYDFWRRPCIANRFSGKATGLWCVRICLFLLSLSFAMEFVQSLGILRILISLPQNSKDSLCTRDTYNTLTIDIAVIWLFGSYYSCLKTSCIHFAFRQHWCVTVCSGSIVCFLLSLIYHLLVLVFIIILFFYKIFLIFVFFFVLQNIVIAPHYNTTIYRLFSQARQHDAEYMLKIHKLHKLCTRIHNNAKNKIQFDTSPVKQ